MKKNEPVDHESIAWEELNQEEPHEVLYQFCDRSNNMDYINLRIKMLKYEEALSRSLKDSEIEKFVKKVREDSWDNFFASDNRQKEGKTVIYRSDGIIINHLS